MIETGKIEKMLSGEAQDVLEIPEFVIETDGEETYRPDGAEEILPLRLRRGKMALKFLALLLLAALVLAAYRTWDYYYNIGVPVSVSPSENITKLQQPVHDETPEVVLTSDTILGVALDFYAIHGLRASIEFVEPDTADASVFMYSRSADHAADNTYLGSLVAEGVEKQSDKTRLGYMGMAGDNMVIGISRSDKVKDYCQENGGSFFRQFILVSNGELPPRFHLHGKVERRAIGRMADRLVYVATRDKETMWDFADALREYGFTDAIYITGGNDYSFYRTADGVRHDIADVSGYPHEMWKGVVPWLVFRKAR